MWPLFAIQAYKKSENFIYWQFYITWLYIKAKWN